MLRLNLSKNAAGAARPAAPPFTAEAGPPAKDLSPMKLLWEVELAAALLGRRALRRDWLLVALKRANDSRKPLYEVLEKSGLSDRTVMLQVLGERLGLGWVDLRSRELETDLLQSFDAEVMRVANAVPLERRQGRLRVGMCDPTNEVAVEMVRRAAGGPIELLLAHPSDVAMLCQELKLLEPSDIIWKD